MKTCHACKKRKPFEEFNWRNKEKGIRNPTCRECSRLYIRTHYRNNTTYYLEKARRRNKVYSEECHRKVFEYFRAHPCVDCGESDPVVLEFDHSNPKTKVAAISEMISRQMSWGTILAEIEKCEVRCANCHRRKTAKENGWYAYLSSV